MNLELLSMMLVTVCAAAGFDEIRTADLVIRHARVNTLDAANQIVQAVAIRGDRIVAVGTDDEIQPMIGPGTNTIDAGGKTLLPGLYDSHVHPLGAAHSEADHPIPVFESLADVMDYISDRVKAQPKGTWIVARYAFPTRLAESRFLTRAELDRIAPEHMVLHQGGPAGVVNSKALAHSGITRDTLNPPAGQIVKDPRTGEPTGILRNAYSVLKDLPSDAYGDDGTPDARRVKLLLFIEPETLATIAQEAAQGLADDGALQGEAGMDRLLAAYLHADQTVGIRHRRWLITHANFTSAANLKLCAELGVAADLQPAWLWKGTRTLLKVLGPRRMEWFHPYRRWLDAGVTIGGGSDHMIRLDSTLSTNPWDPWLGIWVAVTRQTEGAGVFNPDQRLSRIEALRFYTLGSARLHFEERDKGSIEPGKLANLILVDRDPLTCPDDRLAGTRVLWTMVAGRLVCRTP